MAIDSYRFLDFASRQVMKAWTARQECGVIPFTPLAKPLSECTVALVSTAGVARNDDRPFDQECERRNPWWGDPSFRAIPLGTTEKDTLPRSVSPPRPCRPHRAPRRREVIRIWQRFLDSLQSAR